MALRGAMWQALGPEKDNTMSRLFYMHGQPQVNRTRPRSLAIQTTDRFYMWARWPGENTPQRTFASDDLCPVPSEKTTCISPSRNYQLKSIKVDQGRTIITGHPRHVRLARQNVPTASAARVPTSKVYNNEMKEEKKKVLLDGFLIF